MKIQLFLFIFILSLTSCKNNPLNVSPINKDLNIRFINLDSIIKSVNANELALHLKNLKLQENQLLDYQFAYCLNIGNINDTSFSSRISLFLNDPYIKRLEEEIDKTFKDIHKIKTKISTGFLFLNYHFPNKKTPKSVVFMNSFFASNVFCTEDEIGIGMERYLGSDKEVIKELPEQEFHQWIKDKMQIQFLERDVLTGWIMTHYVDEKKENIAEAMVNWGKIIYLTEASFPNEEKHILLRYSEKDYQWALANEEAFWKYLVKQKLLFSKNERDLSNLLNDAPFTMGLPEKGPDRLGQFLGWRIIHSYMNKYPSTSLEQLLKIKYTKILQEYE
jgi:hypothetical protein